MAEIKRIVLPVRLAPTDWEALKDRAKFENSNASAIARKAIYSYLCASPSKNPSKAA
ncbi:MAG: hypothetical protein J0L70_23215 [Leptolyngbya sp. UWPOB_LEPTO1]|uniref:hypothetical protein n=1 Tax=Leptolyngbya sp. UWPOB_LEPTO1 TaxID=2815653 RepID=UPI001AC0E724|nr:hypothetical protein [Leptolyngbya sp. UWPOB_LEPTO1]MBN8563451.1 hypothetical protein [Leptolyngbya sp. UWPOB_LEPTO1]